MDVFSLEDDDCNDLFITQSSNSDESAEKVSNNVQILGKDTDFSSPLCSIVSGSKPAEAQYSDISDEEDFQIPSSQMNNMTTRYVFNVIDVKIL